MRRHAEAALISVAELGSFAYAADALGLTAPNVVRLIRALEASSGARLVRRGRGAILMTEQGAAFVRALRQADPPEASSPSTEALCVDLCAAEARAVVLPALQRFCVTQPAVVPHVYAGGTRELAPWPAGLDGALRLGSEFVARPGARVLGYYRRVTCASAEYLVRRGIPLRLEELDGHTAVLRLDGRNADASPLQFRTAAGETEVSLRVSLATDSLEIQIAAVVEGRGIAQLPLNAAVRMHLARGKLIALLTPHDPDDVPVVLISAPSPARPFAAFAAWLAVLYQCECRRVANCRARDVSLPRDAGASGRQAAARPVD